MKVVVLGGRGYVGSQILQKLGTMPAVASIISINRSKAVTNAPKVACVQADVSKDYDCLKKEFGDATAVISTIGAFGTNEQMLEINGNVNIRAMKLAKEFTNIKRFVYVSTVDNNLPEFILQGYFQGKKNSENELIKLYGKDGYVLKPSFIYGNRAVGNASIPLGLVGKPMELVLDLPGFNKLKDLPGMKAIFASPISVETVASAAAIAAAGVLNDENTNILDVNLMKYYVSKYQQ